MSDPRHISNYHANEREVLRLLEIHEQLTGTGPGRRHNVQILNKSAIVMLVALWEAFVEDLAEGALEFMIANAPSHSVFPESVLERVGSACQGINAWTLAADGWKTVLQNNFKGVLARTTGTLNTPKTAHVNELFEKTIGLKNLSNAWRWSGSSPKKASSKLDGLVALRGTIAHRVTAAEDVGKGDVQEAADFVLRLGSASSNAVRSFIEQRIGTSPWDEYFPDFSGRSA